MIVLGLLALGLMLLFAALDLARKADEQADKLESQLRDSRKDHQDGKVQ